MRGVEQIRPGQLALHSVRAAGTRYALRFDTGRQRWMLEAIDAGDEEPSLVPGAMSPILSGEEMKDDPDIFTQLANHPLAWYTSYRSLLCAGNILRGRLESSEGLATETDKVVRFSRLPFWTLYGLAAENLLKALLVVQRVCPLDKEGNLNKKNFAHHRLNELRERAGIDAPPDTIELLKELRFWVENERYPVPSVADKMTSRLRMSKSSKDLDLLFQFLERLA